MGTKLFKTMNIDGVDQLVLATSYSQIEAYLNCPYRWKLDYLLGKRESVSAEALNLGTAVHSTLEDYFNGVKNGKEITLGEAHDMLDFNLDVNEIPYASKDNQVMAEQQHHAMIEGLVSGTNELAKFMEDKEVVACEKEFRLPVDLPFVVCYAGNKYSRIYINGFIDFIVKDKEGNIYVVDFKSGNKLFQKKKLTENLQLKIYSLVVKMIYGRLPKGTMYYFTRHDTFQEVLPLAEQEEDRVYEFYKNGNIKTKGSLVSEVYDTMISIFRDQYELCKFDANPTPICSWCQYSPWYGQTPICTKAKFYQRRDIKMPKRKRTSLNTTQYKRGE